MTTLQQLDILDLRHFTARQLRPLLEQEAGIWERRLRWDYRGSTELLLQYLDSRILPGFVALDRGRICGFCFCVYEGHKAVIGDIFSDPLSHAPAGTSEMLARHLLETLNASPDIDRIEAQLLLFDSGTTPTSFLTMGFKVYPRLFLERNLSLKQEPIESPPALAAGIELCGWASGFYQATAELIQSAYAGHVDSDINDQYRNLAGSLRFLHNIVRFPGCGEFDPASSWILRDRATNGMVGVILCSRVAPDIAHVTQLCIAPAYRGQQLGRYLLEFCMQTLPGRRYRGITLTVSEQNESAVKLYFASGFGVRQRFDGLVYSKGR